MAPPKFGDLGKDAKDLIDKNFHFGVIKLEANTKAANGAKITSAVNHNTDTGGVLGTLETKMEFPAQGVSMSEKWTTNNVILGNVTVDNKILKGCKADLDTSFAPATGKKSAKVKLSYADCDFLHASAGVDCSFPGLMMNGSGVMAYNGWHAGYEASYDVSNSKVASSNVSLTYKRDDFAMYSGLADNSTYTGSIHHKVSDKLSTAALLQWASGSTSSSLTVCGKYQLDDHSHLKAKIDNKLRVGLSYVQSLRDGVQLTLSGLVNAKSLEQGGHKLGLSLDFDV